jgi:hypothetical protein
MEILTLAKPLDEGSRSETRLWDLSEGRVEGCYTSFQKLLLHSFSITFSSAVANSFLLRLERSITKLRKIIPIVEEHQDQYHHNP